MKTDMNHVKLNKKYYGHINPRKKFKTLQIVFRKNCRYMEQKQQEIILENDMQRHCQ